MGKKTLVLTKDYVFNDIFKNVDDSRELKEIWYYVPNPPQVEGNDNLDNIQVMLAERMQVETDPRLLQPIPYISFVRDTPDGQEVLTYTRGSAGAEDRLHNKQSIGIGGHMEELGDHPKIGFYQLLKDAAIREAQEELGESFVTESIQTAISKALNSVWLYWSDSSEVNKVHLCIFITVHLPNDTNYDMLAEEGVINDLHWRKLSDLKEELDNHTSNLEDWSKAAIGSLTNYE